jgi:hypothetical protein
VDEYAGADSYRGHGSNTPEGFLQRSEVIQSTCHP